MRYVCTYVIQELSGSDIIQALQELFLDAGHLPSSFYTDINKGIILVVAHKRLLENRSKIVTTLAGW